MNVTDFAVKRPQFSLVLLLLLIVVGITSLLGIPKAEDPSFPGTTFTVVAVLPGASPADLERLVTDPIEAKLRTQSGLKILKSKVDADVSVTQAEFFVDIDAERKLDEIEREMGALRPELPKEIVKLEAKQFDTSKVNVLELALVAESVPYRELERFAKNLEKRLENVPGAGDVTMTGLPSQEVHVALDTERLAALGISPAEILGALSAEGVLIPGGQVTAGARELAVKTSGDFRTVDDVAKTVVRSGRGTTLTVGDLAKVSWRDGEVGHFARYGGKRAVLLGVPVRSGQNVFDVRNALVEEIERARRDLPPGAKLEIGFDQSRNIAHRLSGFTRDFALAIVLVLVTLVPLGVRASGVVMVSVPLSLAIGVTLLKLFGFTINQLSIVGFVIALGLLVDDSIVVVENIARFLREGHAPQDAARKATKQILASVLGCTATLMLAFLPLLFLPGTPGLFIRSLPVAVVVTVGASLFVSLTIVPFLASRWLVPEKHEGNRALRALTGAVEAVYRPILSRGLARPKAALVLSLALCAAAFGLVPVIGFSLFPKANLPQFLVTIDAPDGTSLEETLRAAEFVEKALAEHPETRPSMTTVGKSNPQIYYNIPAKEERASYAEVFASVDHFDPTRTPRLFEDLRRTFRGYPGARIELVEFENGPPVDAPIAVRVLGEDRDALDQAAEVVEKAIRATPGTIDIRNPSRDRRTELRVVVDRQKAAELGVATWDVDRTVRLALAGVPVARIRPETMADPFDVRVTLARPEGAPSNVTSANVPRPSFDMLASVWLPSNGGAPVRLGQLAKLELESTRTSSVHYQRERTVLVTARVRDGFNTDRVSKAVLEKLATEQLPPGVRFRAAGEIETRQESTGGLGGAVAVALFGILAVLVLEFRSFKGTLIVASVIPFGIAGGIVGLYFAGYTLSFTANIGFVALMGIEVKNSILLVDYTNQLRKEGVALDAAIAKAGEVRFVPILLTTATALGGLVPLAAERSPLYSPLAVVLIGGLLSSTFLARLVTPVLYRLLPPDIEYEAEEPAPVPLEAAPAPAE
jgi:multidrug efflux pump subunit AcrB